MARTLALALAAAAALLSACSDGKVPESQSEQESESTSSEPPTAELLSETAEAEAAVAGFYEELAAGELQAACDWWTDEYAAKSVGDWNARDYGPEVDSCPDLLSEITEVLAIVGDPATQLAVTDVRGELTGADRARVDVTLAAADQPETYQLTLTPAGWRITGDRAGDLGPNEE